MFPAAEGRERLRPHHREKHRLDPAEAVAESGGRSPSISGRNLYGVHRAEGMFLGHRQNLVNCHALSYQTVG